jgi:hypothetical protein
MKKKIEFIKEARMNGDVFYFTYVDGCFASGSLSMSEETARERYNLIIENNGVFPVLEVLETIEIDAA